MADAAKGEQCVALDMDAAIAAFLADDSQSTLVLPNLTLEQRKQAKKLVDQHPRLKCESYGFGADRQLHVFKEPAAEGDASGPPPPPAGPPALLPVAGLVRDADASWEGQAAEIGSSSALGRLGARKPPGLSTPVGPLEVKHTFIHFGDPEQQDHRQVQSMPPGVFHGALWAEAAALSQKVAEEVLSAPEGPSPPIVGPVLLGATSPHLPMHPKVSIVEKQFSPGTPVEVHGLWKCPAFNGQRGRVGNFDEESGRYNIILVSPTGAEQWAKIKHENLHHVSMPRLSEFTVPTAPPFGRVPQAR